MTSFLTLVLGPMGNVLHKTNLTCSLDSAVMSLSGNGSTSLL